MTVKFCINYFVLLLLLQTAVAQAGNPIVPDVGMADPHIHIFNNKAYLYSTRDAGGPTSTTWNMPDWNIWSSDDLVHWQHERTILPTETYIGKSIDCWAPDAAQFNGKYYLYLSNYHTDTAVMMANDPAGPYQDALGHPILSANLTPTQEYDPSALVDNGVPYLVFGHYTTTIAYYIVRLNGDMISLAETPRPIVFSSSFPADDKPDLTKHAGRYYLSAGANYAVADNIYGPYDPRPIVGDDTDPYGLNGRAHGKLFDWNNQSFFVWCRFINGTGNQFKYRESLITYVHYRANGDIVYDRNFMDAHSATGVGQYDAAWARIEAEWFMGLSDGPQKAEMPTGSGGFVITNLQNGNYLLFPNVMNLPTNAPLMLRAASGATGGSTVEIRENNATGTLLGICPVPATGGWDQYQNWSCTLTNGGGTKNLCFVVKGGAGEVLRLDWFSLGGSTDLPAPWLAQDIGLPATNGSASFSAGTFTVLGNGSDIGGTNDQCQFVYQDGSANCSLVAQVASVQAGLNAWSKAGVMIRDTLNPDAMQMDVVVTPSQEVSCQYRDSTGGLSVYSQTTNLTTPYWVKLTRAGSQFIGYRSPDGVNWTAMLTNTINMGTNVYLGLAVCSHVNGTNCAATFTNVAANNAPTIAAVGNRTLIAGQTLTITNSATDSDEPAQTLAFSLLGPPSGAMVDPNSGVFNWRPAIARSPSTNLMNVIVTDNGAPPLSATQSFTVTVSQPAKPSLGNFSLTNGQFQFSINGDNGPDYMIYGSSNLVDWLPLWTNTAAAPPFTFIDSNTNTSQRFYRILLGP